MPIFKTKIVMGIDPGLAITGYGLILQEKSKIAYLECGVITSDPKEAFGQRLNKIHLELNKIIKKYKPHTIAIEKLFFAKNVKTALRVGEARGVAVLTAWQSKQTIKEFTPLQVKQALTGYGFATKTQIQKMVKQALRLNKIPKPDDAADALAIAICCAQTKEFN
jgi:crossover junction endodeoxyribonuclease RuvC